MDGACLPAITTHNPQTQQMLLNASVIQIKVDVG